MSGNAPNINRYWADLIIEELIRNGVRTFFVAPGSRSAPLVAAVAARSDASTSIHFDERGTSFLSLGFGSRAGEPAAWITTSGTAVANGFAAVVEASQAHVPLILLTSDRPFELRDVGANQAIDQVGIFGHYVRCAFDLPSPDPAIPPASLLTLIDHAVARSLGPPAGPVHLNLPFREPLAPSPAEFVVNESGLSRWRSGSSPFTSFARPSLEPDAEVMSQIETAVRDAHRGLLVVGGLTSRSDALAILDLAERWDWPVLADVTSQLRLGVNSEAVVAFPHFAARFYPFDDPDVVIRFGAKVSSKAVNGLLDEARPSVFAVVSASMSRSDPDHNATHHIVADSSRFCFAAQSWSAGSDHGWLDAWADSSAASGLADRLTEDSAAITEPGIARRLTQLIPEHDVLFLASSMPIRDVDMFASGSGNSCWVGANRGASGIDGTIASATGAGIASGTRVTTLCGDLALLHDLNSLAVLRHRADIVVVLNNDGGGIFSFLPIAEHPDIFEPWFGTPHGFTFEDAARMFGLEYQRPGNMGEFSLAYSAALSGSGSTLIEARTERVANRRLHRELEQQFASALFR